MSHLATITARQIGGNFLRGAFAVALALLYILLLRSVAVQITPPPGPMTEPYPDTSTKQLCEQAGGRWIKAGQLKTIDQPRAVSPAEQPQPYCQGPLRIDREREAQQEKSQQTSLFVFAVGGALAVAASLLLPATPAVNPGLILGGIVAFFFAGTQLWLLAPGWGKLVTLVVLFLLLAGIGIYVFREQPAGKKQ